MQELDNIIGIRSIHISDFQVSNFYQIILTSNCVQFNTYFNVYKEKREETYMLNNKENNYGRSVTKYDIHLL